MSTSDSPGEALCWGARSGRQLTHAGQARARTRRLLFTPSNRTSSRLFTALFCSRLLPRLLLTPPLHTMQEAGVVDVDDPFTTAMLDFEPLHALPCRDTPSPAMSHHAS